MKMRNGEGMPKFLPPWGLGGVISAKLINYIIHGAKEFVDLCLVPLHASRH